MDRRLISLGRVANRSRWRGLAVVVAVVLTPTAVVACSRTPTTSATPLGVHTPKGWTTRTYHGVAVSVPASWDYYGPHQVVGCPGTSVVGILMLGATYSGAGCPSFGGPSATTVKVDPGEMVTSGPIVGFRLNGLSVTQINNNGPDIVWVLTSEDLTVSGSGPDAIEVLHTLRPA